jgi:hypothetical protein
MWTYKSCIMGLSKDETAISELRLVGDNMEYGFGR